MKLTVVKIGGNIIDDQASLESFLALFAAVEGNKILVHGGGKIATTIGAKLYIKPNYVNGRRITDKPTLELVTMVYGGLINKNIVAALQSLKCNAIGLTGADGGVINATKRPVKEIDYGFVGDIKESGVNANTISALMDSGLTPVFAPLTYDGAGGLLNTNADTIAQEIAKAFAGISQVRLIYCFEKNGVLSDPDDESSVINKITEPDLTILKNNGTISGGMIPKIENAFAAVRSGVERVIIGHASQLDSLVKGGSGTCIQ